MTRVSPKETGRNRSYAPLPAVFGGESVVCIPSRTTHCVCSISGGADRIRTCIKHTANVLPSQSSHSPGFCMPKCLCCDTKFNPPRKELSRGLGKFCTRSCSSTYAAALRREKRKPNCSCAMCGEALYRSPSKIKRSKSGLVFCDRRCKERAQRLDGLPAIHLPHYGAVSANYRASAFRAYDHRCRKCGWDAHPQALEVHHLDRDRENNALANLEILCPTCHRVEHLKT